MDSQLIWGAEPMESLIGFKIVGAIEEPDDEENSEGFFGFRAKKGKEEILVWILRDEEGNGPGCLDVVGA